MKNRKLALLCLVICVSMAFLLGNFALAQLTEVNVSLAGFYNITPVDDSGETDSQGIPIDCPGGPT